MSQKQGRFKGKRFNNERKPFFNKNKNPAFQNKNFSPQKREYRHQNQLAEEDVGITEYVSDLKGFAAVIKARFSDFQVNELDLNGRIAKLTDTSVPKDFVEKIIRTDYKSVEISPSEFIPQEKWEAIKKILESEENTEEVTIEADNLSKENRMNVHQIIKSHFGQKIVAGTNTKDGKKVMQFKKYDKDSKEDVRIQWPENKGEYVHFLVYKESMDTMDTCLRIAGALGMSPSTFSYAGLKDKRGKTTQWFCARKVEPWKLIKRTQKVRNVYIGNLEFKDKPLKMGDLIGNKFRIALRNVNATDEEINKTLEQVRKKGFINYYGLQRFGNDKEVPTYMIGVKLLLGEWKEAVNLILKPLESDDPNFVTTKIKQIYAETGDAKKALEPLKIEKKDFRSVEIQLLKGLEKNGNNNYINALENIPRNMRLLYLHSFQSLIWNEMVSKRLKQFGFKPVEGDLVLLENDKKAETEITENEIGDAENDGSLEEVLKCKQKVKELTSEDLPKYTIFDVVLPLPGFDITYPEHMKEFYKERIEQFGLSLEMPKQKVKCYSLGGAYRNIMCEAKDLSWKIMYYNDPTDNLILSDYDEMLGQPEPESVKDGKYKALILELILPSSAYATLFLREILRSSTSSSAQAKLNNYHEPTTNEEQTDKMRSLKKIVCDNPQEPMNVEEDTIEQSNNSLLANKAKYDEFKNSIFKDILDTGEKRKNEEDGESEIKKLKAEEDLVQ